MATAKAGRYSLKDETGNVVSSANSINALSRPYNWMLLDSRTPVVWDEKKQSQVPDEVVRKQVD
jgi:hypothetical protein